MDQYSESENLLLGRNFLHRHRRFDHCHCFEEVEGVQEGVVALLLPRLLESAGVTSHEKRYQPRSEWIHLVRWPPHDVNLPIR